MDTFAILNFYYRIVGIYYESFNFVNQKALGKIKATSSIYFWINIVQTKCIASN